MKKVKAFTLSELLVVMIISTIVIGIAFLVLTMIQKQTIKIKANVSKKQTVEKLDKLLWKDFNEAKIIEVINSNSIIVTKEKDTINYYIHDDLIIRDKDSFPILNKENEFFLDGDNLKKGKIDAMKLNFPKGYIQNIFVFKTYDASFYLNQ